MTSILSSGLEGVARSQQGLQQAASTIASGGQASRELASSPSINTLDSGAVAQDNDLLSAAVDLATYELQFKASVRVIKTDDEVKGSMLDEFV